MNHPRSAAAMCTLLVCNRPGRRSGPVLAYVQGTHNKHTAGMDIIPAQEACSQPAVCCRYCTQQLNTHKSTNVFFELVCVCSGLQLSH
jgi:hypothetical protein